MDIGQLETFLAVAEEGGFSKAAARLHRTQPAVSQVIRKLEIELGEVLFERSSREGTLTAAARCCGSMPPALSSSGRRRATPLLNSKAWRVAASS